MLPGGVVAAFGVVCKSALPREGLVATQPGLSAGTQTLYHPEMLQCAPDSVVVDRSRHIVRGNDVAMLSAAGVGVAMGNACEEALNAADYVTAPVDEDGIARALGLVNVHLLDHFILTDTEYFSMRDANRLPIYDFKTGTLFWP